MPGSIGDISCVRRSRAVGEGTRVGYVQGDCLNSCMISLTPDAFNAMS